ncbi:MAG: P-loop NTPase, partial [Spirochaetes bacterium]|nr:P-loop NTPase [Spirochaetota bacterium]
MSGEIFGSGGGEKAASDLNLDFLGRIPLDAKIRTGSDTGEPIVISEPDSETALNFRSIAKVLAGKISVIQQQKAG